MRQAVRAWGARRHAVGLPWDASKLHILLEMSPFPGPTY